MHVRRIMPLSTRFAIDVEKKSGLLLDSVLSGSRGVVRQAPWEHLHHQTDERHGAVARRDLAQAERRRHRRPARLEVLLEDLQATSYKLQVIRYKLQVTSYKLQARLEVLFKDLLQVTSGILQVARYKLDVTLMQQPSLFEGLRLGLAACSL